VILLAVFLASSPAYADWASFWKKDSTGKKSETKKTVSKEAQESLEGFEEEAGGEGPDGNINEIPRAPKPIVRAPEDPNRTLRGIHRSQATNVHIERAPQKNPASMTPPKNPHRRD